MNTTRFLLILTLLAAGAAGTQLAARDPASPAVPAVEPPAEPKSEMQKWIETTDAQWQEAFKKGVTDMHEAEMNRVKGQYISALEDGIKKASAANDLKGALALRDEQKRFGDTLFIPEQDDAAATAALKQVRAAIRGQLAQAEKNHALRAKALHAKYDQTLAQTQAQLTKAQRLDDAQMVQTKRDEVAAAWITPAVAAAVANAAVVAPPKPTTPAPATLAPRTGGTGKVNILKDVDFSNGTGGWKMTDANAVTADSQEQHNGKPSLRITNGKDTRTMVTQKVAVKAGTRYSLSAYIKTQNVAPAKAGAKEGAELFVGPDTESRRSVPVSKTSGWHLVTYMVQTQPGETEITVGMALGHYYGPVSGTAWFAEPSLTER